MYFGTVPDPCVNLEGHNFGSCASLQLCCMICFDLMTGNPIIFWVLRNFFLSYLHITL